MSLVTRELRLAGFREGFDKMQTTDWGIIYCKLDIADETIYCFRKEMLTERE